MSIVKETIVYCDDCNENGSADDRHKSAKQIRRDRKATDGWIQRGSRDYCPECAPRHAKKVKP